MDYNLYGFTPKAFTDLVKSFWRFDDGVIIACA